MAIWENQTRIAILLAVGAACMMGDAIHIALAHSHP
jgi:hypothetical protein